MNSDPIAVFLLDPEFWVFIVICMIIIMLVLALYTSVFKRMKMNFQVKGALERVLKENDLAMQQFWKDEAVLQKRRLQLKEKEPFVGYSRYNTKKHNKVNMLFAIILYESTQESIFLCMIHLTIFYIRLPWMNRL
ncbi:hypothetical protein [Bartonella sp. AD24XZML]|uniref:hypothetical protein n=1 Tax=Bartonella sp. AD24XZML TaxID=3243463 RepID=UPI0035CEDA1C